MITHKLIMDFVRPESQLVSVVQDDKYSRDLELILLENGKVWAPDDMRVVVRYHKPDGTGGNYDTLPDGTLAGKISDNTVTVALAPQVCTVPGLVKLAVGLVSDAVELHTFSVDIHVHPNPGLQATSDNYFRISGALADSGWTPNKYLATDAEGNVVTADGVDGTGSPRPTNINAVKDGNVVTYSVTRENGSESVRTITMGDEGYPTRIVTDGVECPVNYQGFENTRLGIFELWVPGAY